MLKVLAQFAQWQVIGNLLQPLPLLQGKGSQHTCPPGSATRAQSEHKNSEIPHDLLDTMAFSLVE